jgi:hypothetical protein
MKTSCGPRCAASSRRPRRASIGTPIGLESGASRSSGNYMGGHPYWYAVDYQEDVAAALEALRAREFEAGRYNPVVPNLYKLFPIGPESPVPGAGHSSIEEAVEASAADGTRSILDIAAISAEPDLGASCALSPEELESLFGTTRRSLEQVRRCDALWGAIERGQARHVVIFGAEGPTHLFFAGYSYD